MHAAYYEYTHKVTVTTHYAFFASLHFMGVEILARKKSTSPLPHL